MGTNSFIYPLIGIKAKNVKNTINYVLILSKIGKMVNRKYYQSARPSTGLQLLLKWNGNELSESGLFCGL
jgi:CRISPR/Cas system-associated endonuclease Cas3-HD